MPVVLVEPAAGLTGSGEYCPCIEICMVAHSEGVEAAEAPIDAACWDIAGQVMGVPVWMLPGGKLTEMYHYVTENTGMGWPTAGNGKLCATDMPELGVTPDFAAPGPPVATYC